MNKLFLSPEAQGDLAEIKAYITYELENEPAALRTVSRITSQLRKLEIRGDLGARLSSVADVESDYRYLRCGHYMAFYRFDGEAVYADRILYGKRDYLRVLFGKNEDDE